MFNYNKNNIAPIIGVITTCLKKHNVILRQPIYRGFLFIIGQNELSSYRKLA